jgi:hypothetical protein
VVICTDPNSRVRAVLGLYPSPAATTALPTSPLEGVRVSVGESIVYDWLAVLLSSVASTE